MNNAHLLSADQDLSLFKECELCFWLKHKKQLLRPESGISIFESAARWKLREYFDKYRGGLPPDLTDELEGSLLPDTELINHWRNWHKGLRHSDTVMSAVLFGALDDCLIQDNKYYIPVDFRLMSREPLKDVVKDRKIFLDGLTYLLATNGYKTLEFAYVIFCYPESVAQHHTLKLKKEVVRVDTDTMRAERLFYGAADFLRKRSSPPEEDRGCVYCAWFKARSGVGKS
jgi:hypothetical protein